MRKCIAQPQQEMALGEKGVPMHGIEMAHYSHAHSS